jgi:hypothetical protein
MLSRLLVLLLASNNLLAEVPALYIDAVFYASGPRDVVYNTAVTYSSHFVIPVLQELNTYQVEKSSGSGTYYYGLRAEVRIDLQNRDKLLAATSTYLTLHDANIVRGLIFTHTSHADEISGQSAPSDVDIRVLYQKP